MKFIPPKSGWKTYAVVVVAIGLGVAQQFGVHVPDWVNWGLGFLGLGTLRQAVTTQSAKTASDMADLVRVVLANLTVQPEPTDATGAKVQTVPVEVHVLPDIK